MYNLGGFVAGLLLSIMIAINGTLSTYTSIYLSTFIIHTVGLLTVTMVLFFIKEPRISNKGIPKYLYAGGLIGVLLISLNSICFQKLGVSLTLSIGILAQSLLSAVVDNYGLLGMEKHTFDKRKIPGFLIILFGIIVMMSF